MSRTLWIAIVVLIVLHQDNWFWEDGTLVFGFLPVGLFYHACISLAAVATWFVATKCFWPTDVESTDLGETSKGGAA